MGDYSMVASITRTLVQIVQDGLNRIDGPLARALVTTGRPDGTDAIPQPRVNLFLFHTVPNAYARNLDLPLRTSNGQLLARPSLALDLFYLCSFHGADDVERMEPQQLLGAAMTALNAHPILTPDDINRAASLFGVRPDPRFPLHQAQVTPHSFSVEELSRLWSTFPQVPYALSVCYRVTAAFLETDDVPEPSMPSAAIAPTVQRQNPVAPAPPPPPTVPSLESIRLIERSGSATALTGRVAVILDPAPQWGQAVTLELHPLAGGRSYAFYGTGKAQGATEILFTGTPAGTYLVRAGYDGALSRLTRGTDGRFNGPVLTIPVT